MQVETWTGVGGGGKIDWHTNNICLLGWQWVQRSHLCNLIITSIGGWSNVSQMPFGTWRAANQHYHIRNINIDHWLHSLIPPPLPPSFGFLFWLGVKCKSFALPLLVAMFGQGTALIICPLQLNVLKEWCAFLNCCPFSWPCVIQNIRGQWEWDLDSKGTWNRQREE